MLNIKIPAKVTRFIGNTKLKVVEKSPEIFIAVGIIGFVTSTVMACRATLKLDEVLSETKESLDMLKEGGEKGVYNLENYGRDAAAVYIKTSLKLIRLYAPAAIIGSLSIASVLTSHRIIRSRNAALITAYATLDKSFKEYRKRVANRYGSDAEYEIRHGIETITTTETVTDENGNEVEKEIISKKLPDGYQFSDYARLYDDGCKCWKKDPEHNLFFLQCQQNYANDRLVANGHLFLNEVYDMLGIPRSKEGQLVGWRYKDGIDKFVDFGLTNAYNQEKAGIERSLILDFNVDGVILDNFVQNY